MSNDKLYRTEESEASSGRSTTTAGKLPATARLSGAPRFIFRVESAEAAHALAGAFGSRDDNGVAQGADVAVDRAAGSSGSSLPGDLRGRFESSLGADLSGVRVHTGGESAEAASAVGAKAYTTGNDIHFGAGHYDPQSAFGVHLLAHEVAHTVQQQGAAPTRQHKLEVSAPQDAAEVEADRAAETMVAGIPAEVTRLEHGAAAYRRPALIQRDPAGQGSHAGLEKTPEDMEPSDWKAMVQESAGPDTPSAIAIPVKGRAPLPKGVTRDPRWDPPERCQPGHHEDWKNPWDTSPKYSLSLFDRRDAAWEGYRASVNGTVNTFNAAAPLISSYATAESDPQLSALYEFQQDTKKPGNLHQLANQQKVPRTNGSGLAVGDLFSVIKGEDGSKISVGREANTKGLEDNIGKAAKSEAVEKAITNLKAKDSSLQGTLDLLAAAEKESSAAGHTLAGSKFAVTMEEETAKGETAKGDLDGAQAKAASVKSAVDGTLKVITFIATTLAAPGAAAAGGAIMIGGGEIGQYKPNEGKPGIAPGAQGIADIAGSSITSTIAEKIVSWAYGSEIGKAEKALNDATKAYRTARHGKANEDWLAATDLLAASVSKVSAQVNFLKEKLSQRKNAYLELAGAAATAGGGTKLEQDRMKGLIMAIPVGKAVVAQTSNVLNLLADPPMTHTSQVGFTMACNTGDGGPLQLITTAGQIAGYRTQFKDSHEFWSARVASLEGVIAGLSGK